MNNQTNQQLTLAEAEIGKEWIVTDICTDDEELNGFLFTLGCYKGESIVVVGKVSGNYVVAIKDSRYNIDPDLAQAILVA